MPKYNAIMTGINEENRSTIFLLSGVLGSIKKSAIKKVAAMAMPKPKEPAAASNKQYHRICVDLETAIFCLMIFEISSNIQSKQVDNNTCP